MRQAARGEYGSTSSTEEDALPPLVHAQVYSGKVLTEYTQAGEGAPVVLLRPRSAPGYTSPLFFGGLPRHFRLVAPVLERGGLVYVDDGSRVPVAFSRWLWDFLDGLGLARVSLVTEEPFGVPALEYALLDPDRVKRIALLFRDVHPGADLLATASDAFALTGTAVTVIRVGSEQEGLGPSSADLIQFLTDAEGRPPGGFAP